MKYALSPKSAFVAGAATLAALVISCSSSSSSSDASQPASSSGNTSSSSSSSSGNASSSSSSTSSSSSGSSTSGLDWASYATAQCNFLMQCLPGLVVVPYGDVPTCASANVLRLQQIAALPGSSFTQAQIDACVQSSSANASTCSSHATTLAACEFHGTLATGAACVEDTQCAAGSFCGGPPTAASTDPDCSTCLKYGEAGDSCFADDGECDPDKDLQCLNQKCTARLAAGATCSAGEDAPECGGDNVCLNGKCSARLAAGATCDPTADTCADTLTCDDTTLKCTVQAATTYLAVGAACDPSSQTTACKKSYCATTTSKCTAFEPLGTTCDPAAIFMCDPSLRLECDDTTMKCVVQTEPTCK